MNQKKKKKKPTLAHVLLCKIRFCYNTCPNLGGNVAYTTYI